MARYSLLSPKDSELLPEEKLAQIAGFLGGGRNPQSNTQQDITPTQPTGEPPQGAGIALGDVGGGTGVTDTGEDVLASQQPEFFKMMIEQVRDRERRAAPLIQEGRRGVDELAGKIRSFENQPNQLNVAPVLNWLDSQYGTNLSKGYERPMNEQEKLAKVAAMYKELQGSREQVIQDALGLGNNKLMDQALMQQGRKATSDEHAKARIGQQETNTITRWGEQIDKQAGKYSQLVDQAQTDYNTLKKNIEGKELLPSQLFNELQYGLARLIKGPGALAEGTVERVELNSLQQDWANQIQKISGQIQGAVPDQFKQQLLHSFERLLEQWKERRAGVALQAAVALPMYRIPGSEKDINKKLSAYGTSLPGMEIDKTIHSAVQKHGVEVSPLKENKEPTLEELQAEMAERAAKRAAKGK